MNKIFIHDLRVEARIGVYDWERHLPQTVRLDLEIGAPSELPFQSGKIADALDYAKVVAAAEGVREGRAAAAARALRGKGRADRARRVRRAVGARARGEARRAGGACARSAWRSSVGARPSTSTSDGRKHADEVGGRHADEIAALAAVDVDVRQLRDRPLQVDGHRLAASRTGSCRRPGSRNDGRRPPDRTARSSSRRGAARDSWSTPRGRRASARSAACFASSSITSVLITACSSTPSSRADTAVPPRSSYS